MTSTAGALPFPGSTSGVFAGITGCMVVVMVSIGVFGPKTNGLWPEEISH